MDGQFSDPIDPLSGAQFVLLSSDRTDKHGIAKHLESWGANLIQCNTVARAFTHLMNHVDSGQPIAAIIVDRFATNIDPLQFAAALKAEPDLASLKLAHIIPSGNQKLSTTLNKAGYNILLTTPVDKTLLFNALLGNQHFGDLHSSVTPLLKHYSRQNQNPLDILLAGSEPKELERTHLHLLHAGHRVFPVSDGKQALEALENHYFDLALLDADLHGNNGFEVLKLYHFARLGQAWVPSIIMTDSLSTKTIRDSEAANANLCISKPTDRQSLLYSIQQVVTDALATESSSDPFSTWENTLVDRTHLNNLVALGTSSSFLDKLVSQFEQECTELLADMERSVSNGQYQSVHLLCHTMKDTTGNMGAIHLYRIISQIVRLESAEMPNELPPLLVEAKSSFKKTVESLRSRLLLVDNSSHLHE